MRTRVLVVCIIILVSSCAGRHSRLPPDSYYESMFICTGDITRYPAYKIRATESLLATIQEEVRDLKRDYPHYKVSSISGQGGVYDFFSISRPFRNDKVIAYEVSAFIEANKKDYHRMSKEEAIAIVKYMIQEEILDVKIPIHYLEDIDSWPTDSGGTLDVNSPGNGWRGRYEWEFGDWVHRLYSFGKMNKPWGASE
jgi:hypothetical protein